MTSEIVCQVAERLDEHQTSRGDEFRDLSTQEIIPMARAALIARCQVKASNADWDDESYRYHMRCKKEQYLHHAGNLGVSIKEANAIWWSYVHENPSPHKRRRRI